MKSDLFKFRQMNNLPVFLNDKEVEVIDYQDIFNIAFIRIKDEVDVVAIDIMTLLDKPTYEDRISINMLDFSGVKDCWSY